MSDEIRINGNQLSWGSIKLRIDGEPYFGFNSLDYGDKLTRTKGYGMGLHHAPRGRSRGKYETDNVKIGGPKASFQILRAALAAKSASGTSYGNVEFEIIAQWTEPGVDGGDAGITVEIGRCTWTGDSSSDSESPDPSQETAEFDCMSIRRNGLVLFDDSEPTP